MLFLTMCPPVIHEDGDQRGVQRNPQHTKRFFALRLWHACFQHAFFKRFFQFHALHHCLSSAWHLEFSVAGFAGATPSLPSTSLTSAFTPALHCTHRYKSGIQPHATRAKLRCLVVLTLAECQRMLRATLAGYNGTRILLVLVFLSPTL